ncbi:MAG: M20/M25/M40 family metallo-hydrolase, partial [Bryobacterales bacterium]|nr:M20/M25/M40 family metallo-hydrolase [Bryobacterales bacterium]
DSWSTGTGATDDGAGVVIAMEAMRILQAIGARPRRTIRLALWGGEEQGSLGSRAWVKPNVGQVPLAESLLPEFLRSATGPVRPQRDHARISAVYTLDAGGGRIRGVSTGNPALVPLFKEWMAPLADLGATMVAPRSDCGGDCWTFEQLGIPTPSFKQDPLDYNSRTHHTNMDTFEHLIEKDLTQAAVVVASILYRTAMHEELLPRLDP